MVTIVMQKTWFHDNSMHTSVRGEELQQKVMSAKNKCLLGRKQSHFKAGDDQRRHLLGRQPGSNNRSRSPQTEKLLKNYTRLPKDVYDAVRNPTDLAHTVLRPSATSESVLQQSVSEQQQQEQTEVAGNRIVHMETLCQVMSTVCRQHQEQYPWCHADFRMPSEGERRVGLGVVIDIRCKNCEYRYTAKLYEELYRPHVPGINPPKANIQLSAFMMKSATSLGDARLLLASLDIPPITESSLSKHISQVAPLLAAVNQEQMAQNCEVVKSVLRHRASDDDDDGACICLTDTVFNNPPKGRSMSQPGTQCSTPMVEGETTLNMVVALSTHSKLCSKGVRCNLCHGDGDGDGGDGSGQCPANYPVHRPMGNAEKLAMEMNVLQVEKSGLKVTGIVTDGTAKVYHAAGINAEKLHCIVHLARSQRKRVQGMLFSEGFVGSKDRTAVSRFKYRLATALSKRCTMELKAAKNRHGMGPAFLEAAAEARGSILLCFQGDHSRCHLSGVCHARGVDTPPSYLPYNRYLTNMSPDDEHKLQSAVDFRLNKMAANQQRHLSSTNPVEALHLRSLRLCPKTKNYTKNYHARGHSAVHSHSVGHHTSLYTICKKMNIAQVNSTHLLAMQKREKYWHLRQQSIAFKRRRRQLSHESWTLKRFSCLNIENGVQDDNTRLDHNY